MDSRSSAFTGCCGADLRKLSSRASSGLSTCDASAMMSGTFAETVAGADSRIRVASTAWMVTQARSHAAPAPGGPQRRSPFEDIVCDREPPLRLVQPELLARGHRLPWKTV